MWIKLAKQWACSPLLYDTQCCCPCDSNIVLKQWRLPRPHRQLDNMSVGAQQQCKPLCPLFPSLSVSPSEAQGGSVLQGPPRDDGADRPQATAPVRSPDAGPEPRRQETHHSQAGLGQRVRTHTHTQTHSVSHIYTLWHEEMSNLRLGHLTEQFHQKLFLSFQVCCTHTQHECMGFGMGCILTWFTCIYLYVYIFICKFISFKLTIKVYLWKTFLTENSGVQY